MKKYIIENIILLLFDAFALFWTLSYNNIILTVILVPNIIIMTFGLSWRTILLPLDLMFGPKEREMYYSGLFGTDDMEFFRHTKIRKFKFYYGAKELLVLLSLDDFVCYDKNFSHGDYIHIMYYRFSKILKSAEKTSKGGGNAEDR